MTRFTFFASALVIGIATAAAQPARAQSAPSATPVAPHAMAGQAAGMAMPDAQRGMHEKMMAAKTPEERQALMTEHMKSMQGGMAMMGQMKAPDAKGGSKSMSPEMMGKRMDMMEMMMQMMIDREVMQPPAPR